MRCKFPERDLVQRLDQTFCRYDGKPYYVRIDTPNIMLHDIRTKRTILNIHADDPRFDISTIPLGYMQYMENRVVYLSRAPMRIFKQGVSLENLAYHYTNDKMFAGKVNVYSQAFIDMIEGNYGDLEKTLITIQGTNEPTEIAISRDIALSNVDGPIVVVYYKNKQVGWIPPNQRIVIVPSSEYAWIVSKYLSELKWEVR